MTRPLYNEYFAENEAGQKLSDEFYQHLSPIFKTMTAMGYSPRDIYSILMLTASNVMSETVLTFAAKKYDKEGRRCGHGEPIPGPCQECGAP